MNKRLGLKRENKKKGFTLIELIAVLAIVALLMVVFVPKVSGYIGEAKKVKALEQVRQVVLAVDSYNIDAKTPIEKTSTYGTFKTTLGSYADNKDLVNINNIKSISNDMTYTQMKELLQENKEFDLNDSGVIVFSSTVSEGSETNSNS